MLHIQRKKTSKCIVSEFYKMENNNIILFFELKRIIVLVIGQIVGY